jgi:hypothetical protein
MVKIDGFADGTMCPSWIKPIPPTASKSSTSLHTQTIRSPISFLAPL